MGTTVSPVISANVDSRAEMVDPTNRITNQPNVTITGAATPGATISYSETGESAVSATADATGNYSVTIPLLTARTRTTCRRPTPSSRSSPARIRTTRNQRTSRNGTAHFNPSKP